MIVLLPLTLLESARIPLFAQLLWAGFSSGLHPLLHLPIMGRDDRGCSHESLMLCCLLMIPPSVCMLWFEARVFSQVCMLKA